MAKFSNILNIILRILAILALVLSAGLSLATAYIVFAPDNLPKPFYLQYIYPTPSAEKPGEAGPEATPTPTPAPTVEVRPGEGLMINSGTKIINLTDPAGRKYIRISVVLEFSPTDPAYLTLSGEARQAFVDEFNNTINAKMPLIDDAIITLISTKSFDTLYTAEGKDSLRQEIMARVNQRLPEFKVISVYFTEFVVE